MPKQRLAFSEIGRLIKFFFRLAYWLQALFAYLLICRRNHSVWFWWIFDDVDFNDLWYFIREYGYRWLMENLFRIPLLLYGYAILYTAVARLTYLILSRIYPVVWSMRDIFDSQTDWTLEQVEQNDRLDGKIGFVSLWFSVTGLIFLEGLRQSVKTSPFILILLLWIVFLLPVLEALKELRETTVKKKQ